MDPYSEGLQPPQQDAQSKITKGKTKKSSLRERVFNSQQKFEKFIDTKFFNEQWEDGAFMDDVCQATLRGAHPMASLLLWLIIGFIFTFILWASVASLDESTIGEGQIIPSGKVQTVQNLEGGIIKKILVHEGQIVDKGQALIEIDDTGFSSSLEEKRKRYYTLQGNIARLVAVISGEKPVFPPELQANAPDILKAANNLYISKIGELSSAKAVLKRQIEQRYQEIKEAKELTAQTRRDAMLSRKEYEMAVPLEQEGVISQVELLRLERDVNNAEGDASAAKSSISKANSAMREAQARLKETALRFQNESKQELNESKDEFNRLSEVLKAESDKVDRTTVRAPVRSQVKQVLVNTIGGVVRPGMDLVELIPLNETLLLEARIKPQDIAFIRPGQETMVKITAYDFTVYGGLKGHLERIGSDTITDEDGNPFYMVRIRTEKNYLSKGSEKLPIITGMVANVDIITGKKTVLDYILKPILKARSKALKER